MTRNGAADAFLGDLFGVDTNQMAPVAFAEESEKLAAEITKLQSKLGNKDFVDRAPPEVVEEQRERVKEAQEMLAKLEAAQKGLAG